jgi:AraC-like DNA-binding protein
MMNVIRYYRPATDVTLRLPLNVRSAGWMITNKLWRHGAGTVDRINVYWGIAGEIKYTVNGVTFITLPNELLTFPFGSTMGPASESSTGEFRWFTLDGSLAVQTLQIFGIKFFKPFSAGNCPRELHNQLLEAMRLISPYGINQYQAENLAYELLTRAAMASNIKLQTTNGGITRALALIDAEYSDPALNVNAMADRLGMNRSVLTRLFTQQFGMAPSAYLELQRLRLAAKLLESGESVKTAANSSGYTDPRYFARLFKTRFGVPPVKWRHTLQ